MNFKFGRKRPAIEAPRLMFSDYLGPDLPEPPAVCHFSQAAHACLMQVYGNDDLGDCTAAGAGHIVGLARANAGNGLVMPTKDEVIAFYSKTTGYVPGDPATDQGGDEITVLNDWKKDGFFADGSSKIAAWANVNGAAEREIKQAMWLFENLYFGVELPDAWVTPFPSGHGFVWDVAGAPNPSQGHAFAGVGYNAVGVQIDTWGLIGTLTWAAIAKYATTLGQGELHAVLDAEAISRATAKAPNGYDFAALQADFAKI